MVEEPLDAEVGIGGTHQIICKVSVDSALGLLFFINLKFIKKNSMFIV